MLAHDRVIPIFLYAAIATSVACLGLSAYIVSSWQSSVPISYYDPTSATDVVIDNIKIPAPGQVTYLIFLSLWSLLVTAVLIAITSFLPERFSISNKGLAVVTLALEVVTTIQWFGGFSALAAYFVGFLTGGALAALLAFAILSWLIYFALTILTVLTACGVVKSERRGRGRLFGRAPHNAGPVVQQVDYTQGDQTYKHEGTIHHVQAV